MHKQTSIQLKAAFLLCIFALNTLVGFACSVGINMGFNNGHHEEILVPVVHIHKDGKEHIHHESKPANHDDKEKSEDGTITQKVSPHHHDKQAEDLKKEKKDDCCKDKVIKFELTDKAVAKAFSYQSPLFAPSFFNYNYADALYASCISPRIKYFVRSYHPPIPDIRVAIQSFQI